MASAPFVGQGQLEHLFDILHIVESQSVQIDRLYFLNILAVLFTQDDILDTSRLAARIFSLIPPTGRTFPRRVISPVMADWL